MPVFPGSWYQTRMQYQVLSKQQSMLPGIVTNLEALEITNCTRQTWIPKFPVSISKVAQKA